MFGNIDVSGFFPARVLVRPGPFDLVLSSSSSSKTQRTFLKDATTNKNIPIHAIGLSLYEPIPGVTSEELGKEVVRTQWP